MAADELEKLRAYKTLTKLRMKQAAEKLATYRVQVEEATKKIQDLEAARAEQASNEQLRRRSSTIPTLTPVMTTTQPRPKLEPLPVTTSIKALSATTKLFAPIEPKAPVATKVSAAPAPTIVAPMTAPKAPEPKFPQEAHRVLIDGATEKPAVTLSLSDEADGSSDGSSTVTESDSDTDTEGPDASTPSLVLSTAMLAPSTLSPTAAPPSPTELEPPAKRLKTEEVPPELSEFLAVAQTVSGAKIYRATKMLQTFFDIVRNSSDRVATAALLQPKLVAWMGHHVVPLLDVLAAFVGTANTATDISIHVDALAALAPADAPLALAHISRHMTRKKSLPTKNQVGWCRVHTFLSSRAGTLGATKTFLVDRMLADNRHVLDFVAIGESWPAALASLAVPCVLAATLRYLIGALVDARAMAETVDLQAAAIQEMYALFGGSFEADAAAVAAAFAAEEQPQTFELNQSVRLLVTVLGWTECKTRFPCFVALAQAPTAASLRFVGSVAATLMHLTNIDAAFVMNEAKAMIDRLIAAVEDTAGDEHLRDAAVVGLLEVASSVPAKALSKEYMVPVLSWFGAKTPQDQMALPASFLRKLQQTVRYLT
ncbi:hypothetical protein ACHHYP_13061 [Achlya hypogyna]|uniref:Uncharacterized protein n=1 Tax=Achlya hypogyna TaxID=1202772 RepID=A0A1V9YG96_ACHHY|nr:hypothetical protein ACHHYP_13061 [Achlya hypogyna]